VFSISVLALLRFDLATLAMVLWPSGLALVSGNRMLHRFLSFIQNSLIYLFPILLILSNLELYYNGRYPGLASLQYGDEAHILLRGLIERDSESLLLLASILLILPPLLSRLPAPKKVHLLPQIAVLAGLIIALRGGMAPGILRPADALKEKGPGIVTNGFFVLAHSLLDQKDFAITLDESDWQEFLKESGTSLYPEYPLLRYADGRSQKRSVFLIILESVSQTSSEVNLPRLSQLPWERLPIVLGAGGRSANGIFSITTGILDRNDRSVLRSADALTRYGTLGNILKARNLPSYFYYPARIELDHLDRFLRGQGFSEVLGPAELKASEDCAALQTVKEHLLTRLQKGEMFLSIYFSVNSHHPYLGTGLYSADPYEDSVRTTDGCLADLLTELDGQPLEVLLTSDHTEHRRLDPIADKTVPIMRFIHSGRIPVPLIKPGIASQLDLLPTILDLLGGNFFHHALGDSLLRANHRNRALTIGGSGHQVLGFAREGELFLFWPWIPEERYRYSLLRLGRPFDPTNRADQFPKKVEAMGQTLSRIYGGLRRLEATNRLWPAHLPLIPASRP